MYNLRESTYLEVVETDASIPRLAGNRRMVQYVLFESKHDIFEPKDKVVDSL